VVVNGINNGNLFTGFCKCFGSFNPNITTTNHNHIIDFWINNITIATGETVERYEGDGRVQKVVTDKNAYDAEFTSVSAGLYLINVASPTANTSGSLVRMYSSVLMNVTKATVVCKKSLQIKMRTMLIWSL
jgi:hypothetical protein